MKKEFKIVDPYEHDLHTYLWESDKTPKGVVQILHGAGEHVNRYDDFAQYLNTQGYHVIGNDHLGHGKTDEEANTIYFDSSIGFHKVYEGVKTVRDYIEEHYDGLPVIMFAHSMGSFIGRYAILYDHKRYDQAIFTGTALFNPVTTFFARILSNVMVAIRGDKHVSEFFNHRILDSQVRSMKRNGIINKRIEWISQDRNIQNEVLNDPLCNREFTMGAQKDILHFIPEIQDKQRIKKAASATAIFFISGDLDALGHYGTDAKKLFNIYHDCGYSNVKYTVVNNSRHEIINELDKESHYKMISDWIERNL